MATVSDRPWSDFTEADFSPEQWRRSCVLHLVPGSEAKQDHKLPVREPSGTLNRNGCHAAAGALAGSRGGLVAPASVKAKAAKVLVGLYRQDLQEDAPPSLLALAGMRSAGRSAEVLQRAVGGLQCSQEGDGRTIRGRCLVYGETALIDWEGPPYRERMERGCAARSVQDHGHRLRGTVLHDQHRLPLGPVRAIEERDDGLWVDLYVSHTRMGDEVLQLVNDKAMDGLSVAFKSIRQELDTDGVLVRKEIALKDLSVVTTPAYDGARITAVRSAHDLSSVSVDDARRRLQLLVSSWW